MQRLQGDGWAFVHAGGTLHERDAGARAKTLRVDTGCIVAFQPTVDYDIQSSAGSRRRCSAAKGCSSPRCAGPGKVWLQSLPFSPPGRPHRRRRAAGGRGGREEGSVLGGLGGLLDGDNS